MNFPKRTATEEVIDKISKLKGPNRAERGGLLLMESVLANHGDLRHQHADMVRVADKMTAAFNKAFPNLQHNLIDDVVADLASLWNLRQKLDKDLRHLFQMRFPQHRDHLHSFLIDIEVRQLDEASYLIRRLRKRLPTLLRALDRQEQSGRRATRTRPPQKASKSVVARA